MRKEVKDHYEEKYQNYYELIMAVMLMEEKITSECIKDELTGVYLIDKVKLDSIVLNIKKAVPPVCIMPVRKATEKHQRTLNGLLKKLFTKQENQPS